VLELPGGGGFGSPFKREPGRVANDVKNGYISREAAKRDYGVALRDDLSVDSEATKSLRTQRAAE
jgi:N-methylhydantoinase B